MSKRKQIAGLIFLLSIFSMPIRPLYGATDDVTGSANSSPVANSGDNPDTTTLHDQTAADKTPARVAPARKDWMIHIGVGTLFSPAFIGSSEYQLLLVPALKVAYLNTFFASVEEGIGYAAFNQYGWSVGPIAKVSFGRRENGNNPFRVFGSKTTALHGLGNIDTTLEAGGFAEYRWSGMSTKIGLRKGLNGHEGLVGDLSANYKQTSLPLSPLIGSPLVVSVGPRLTVVDAAYNKAFFGINDDQARRSGLPRYSPSGGILSYGFGGIIIVPITQQLSATILAGYDRLTGDAGSSPLVSERGSPDQVLFGVIFNYEFGFDRL